MAFLIYIFFILLGLVKVQSKIVNFLQCFLVVTLYGYSQDGNDWWVYESLYDSARSGFDMDYEIGYMWLNTLVSMLGLDYIGFRIVIGTVCCIVMSIVIRSLTHSPNVVWSFYLIYSVMLDACLLRNSLSMVFSLVAILFFFKSRSYIDYVFSVICLILATLFHSAYWLLLLMIPLWYLSNTRYGYIKVFVIIAILYIIAVTSNNLIFSVYSNLLIREATVDKYMTGHYSNIAGAIYNILKYVLIVAPVIYYNRISQKKNFRCTNQATNNMQTFFKANILRMNIIFSVVLIPLFFAPNFSRLFRIIVLLNYIYIANQLDCNIKAINTKVLGIIFALSLICLTFFYESPTTLQDIFYMHFETNKFLNLFNI